MADQIEILREQDVRDILAAPDAKEQLMRMVQGDAGATIDERLGRLNNVVKLLPTLGLPEDDVRAAQSLTQEVSQQLELAKQQLAPAPAVPVSVPAAPAANPAAAPAPNAALFRWLDPKTWSMERVNGWARETFTKENAAHFKDKLKEYATNRPRIGDSRWHWALWIGSGAFLWRFLFRGKNDTSRKKRGLGRRMWEGTKNGVKYVAAFIGLTYLIDWLRGKIGGTGGFGRGRGPGNGPGNVQAQNPNQRVQNPNNQQTNRNQQVPSAAQNAPAQNAERIERQEVRVQVLGGANTHDATGRAVHFFQLNGEKLTREQLLQRIDALAARPNTNVQVTLQFDDNSVATRHPAVQGLQTELSNRRIPVVMPSDQE